MDYGTKFNLELEKLLWEFLIRLDQLLPVPSLAQVVGAFENSFLCFVTNYTLFLAITALQRTFSVKS